MVFHFSFNMHSLITIEFTPLAILVLLNLLLIYFAHFSIEICFFILIYNY